MWFKAVYISRTCFPDAIGIFYEHMLNFDVTLKLRFNCYGSPHYNMSKHGIDFHVLE